MVYRETHFCTSLPLGKRRGEVWWRRFSHAPLTGFAIAFSCQHQGQVYVTDEPVAEGDGYLEKKSQHMNRSTPPPPPHIHIHTKTVRGEEKERKMKRRRKRRGRTNRKRRLRWQVRMIITKNYAIVCFFSYTCMQERGKMF